MIKCLNDGFVQLINHMGDDHSICRAARISYGNHTAGTCSLCQGTGYFQSSGNPCGCCKGSGKKPVLTPTKDRNLIRYLMRHRHTTPFEMVSFIFLVRAPIHVARQWFRHRTWSYNEYSTRYKPAIDSFETTEPDKWRKQATNNKQGSGDYIEAGELSSWPQVKHNGVGLSNTESNFHDQIRDVYQERLEFGVAREQARKDLPLSTYTEFYAKVDLHNLFHFLSLRLDAHAQLEIRTYAETISKIIKPIVPISYEAFEDYRLNGAHFSAQEMEILRSFIQIHKDRINTEPDAFMVQEDCVTLSTREWNEFKEKLS